MGFCLFGIFSVLVLGFYLNRNEITYRRQSYTFRIILRGINKRFSFRHTQWVYLSIFNQRYLLATHKGIVNFRSKFVFPDNTEILRTLHQNHFIAARNGNAYFKPKPYSREHRGIMYYYEGRCMFYYHHDFAHSSRRF